jgi:hypothetical protein
MGALRTFISGKTQPKTNPQAGFLLQKYFLK